MRVAALQADIVWEDPTANFAHLGPRLEAAAGAGARLLVLPEMFSYGFSMNTRRIAEEAEGPSTAFLRNQARRLGAWICGSLPLLEPRAGRPHNALTLAGPDGELFRYRKIHPFTFDGEHEHYEAGTELATFEVEGVRLTPFVCYDLRFGDEFWQRAEATDLYVVVANWPAARREHWRTLLRARAIENQAYVVGLNRVGRGGADGRVAYAGDSAIVDPWGEVLAEAAADPAVLEAEIDPERLAEARQAFPVLRDRRGAAPGSTPRLC